MWFYFICSQRGKARCDRCRNKGTQNLGNRAEPLKVRQREPGTVCLLSMEQPLFPESQHLLPPVAQERARCELQHLLWCPPFFLQHPIRSTGQPRSVREGAAQRHGHHKQWSLSAISGGACDKHPLCATHGIGFLNDTEPPI